jgi:hypothetical protein
VDKPVSEQKLTTEDARRLLDQERDERLQRCQVKIQAALQEEGCRLVSAPQIVDGRIIAPVQLVIDE